MLEIFQTYTCSFSRNKKNSMPRDISDAHAFIFTRPLDFSKKHTPSFSRVKIIIIIKLLSNFMHALYETILFATFGKLEQIGKFSYFTF